MSSTGSSRLPLLLGLLVVAAGAVYWDMTSRQDPGLVEARRPVQPDGTRVSGRSADTTPTAGMERHPLAQLQLASLRETVQRPLFEPTRRGPARPQVTAAPPPPRAAQPSPARTEPPRHRLIGVVIGPDRSTAVLAAGNERPVRVETGDTIDGWQVAQITHSEVTLTRGSQKVALAIVRRVESPTDSNRR